MRFSNLLIANRGEIACRIIRSSRKKGLESIAIFSEADRNALHVRKADHAICVGPAPASQSYLDIEAILAAADECGAQAIHPGYGFLSERADFADAVEKAGLTFVGPPSSAIKAMGDKAQSKRIMQEAGVPCVPGYEGEDQSHEQFIKAADEIGYPVMVKASAGGGGRGMRQVFDAHDLPAALKLAKSEAANAFGNDALILEKLVQKPRHVEIQIFADNHGNIIHLGERDCSVQRRHQKVIEEAPSPIMSEKLRHEMGEAAVNAARAVNYRGAGTVEFLVDENSAFYFLEMNTRIQVEHPVTELVTGTDLIDMQLDIAMGQPLQISQGDVQLAGHAIEVRLYAENPANSFLPDSGNILAWDIPVADGIRLDSAVERGDQVSTHYDPMLAKLISYGQNRDEAIAKLISTLRNSALAGISTNQAFLLDLLYDETFAKGEATTALLDEKFPDGYDAAAIGEETIALGTAIFMHHAMLHIHSQTALANPFLGWSSSALPYRDFAFELNGEIYNAQIKFSARQSAADEGSPVIDWQVLLPEKQFTITLQKCGAFKYRAQFDQQKMSTVSVVSHADSNTLEFCGNGIRYVLKPVSSAIDIENQSSDLVTAPMPGTLLELKVAKGDVVEKNQTIAILEAMKMQHPLTASRAGIVNSVHASTGQQLLQGRLIIELEPENDSMA